MLFPLELTPGWVLHLCGGVKPSLVPLALAALLLASCTTLENRRDMYNPQKVNGPYTRMLNDGIPRYHHVLVPGSGGSSASASDGKSVVR